MFLLLITSKYVVTVRKVFFFLLVLGIGCVTVRLQVPGHFYSCVVSKYLLRENEISFLLL